MPIMKLNWWLVYGPPRTGTTLMLDLVASRSKQYVSDWGLANILMLAPEKPYIKFDRLRALGDICANILDNAPQGGGLDLDLVFKQADLTPREFDKLKLMWGEPARIIFCIREPSGYLASATKKFAQTANIQGLQRRYIRSIENHAAIGGDVFDYGAKTTAADYIEFLRPLAIDASSIKFEHKGGQSPEPISAEVWERYQAVVSNGGAR